MLGAGASSPQGEISSRVGGSERQLERDKLEGGVGILNVNGEKEREATQRAQDGVSGGERREK